MPDEQNNHPLYSQPSRNHPLSDEPPEPEKPKGVAIRIPLRAQVPMLTYALIVINVGIFALRYLLPELSNEILLAGYIDVDLVINEGQYYRLFTGMFLHFNEAHILFNGIALYYIGTNLERLFGHLRFGLVYLLGGLGGSIFPLLFGGGGLGASGAVFAIWGAEMIFLYQHQQLFGAAGRARLQNSLMMMIVNFIAGFSANALANVADSGVRIGNAAHFGGLIAGAIIAWLIAPRLIVKRVPPDEAHPHGVQIIDENVLSENLSGLLYVAVGLIGLLLVAVLLRG